MYSAPVYTFNQVITISAASYTLQLRDGLNNYLRFTNASPTITLPLNSAVNFPVGSQIFVKQIGAALTIAVGAGLTLNGGTGNYTGSAQYGVIILTKVAANTWEASGTISAP